MLWWDKQERSLQLVEFDLEKALASLNAVFNPARLMPHQRGK